MRRTEDLYPIVRLPSFCGVKVPEQFADELKGQLRRGEHAAQLGKHLLRELADVIYRRHRKLLTEELILGCSQLRLMLTHEAVRRRHRKPLFTKVGCPAAFAACAEQKCLHPR